MKVVVQIGYGMLETVIMIDTYYIIEILLLNIMREMMILKMFIQIHIQTYGDM